MEVPESSKSSLNALNTAKKHGCKISKCKKAWPHMFKLHGVCYVAVFTATHFKEFDAGA